MHVSEVLVGLLTLRMQVSADQQEAEKVKIVVAAEEQEVGVMQQRTQAMAEEAKADLAEALPALQAAIDSLKALNKNDITEVGVSGASHRQGIAECDCVGYCAAAHASCSRSDTYPQPHTVVMQLPDSIRAIPYSLLRRRSRALPSPQLWSR